METAGSAGQPVLELTDIGKEFGAHHHAGGGSDR